MAPSRSPAIPDERGAVDLSKTFGHAKPGWTVVGERAAGMDHTRPFSPGEPVGPYDGFSRTPRSRDFVTGYNIATRPRTHERVAFDTLRGLIEAYDVAQIALWHRIDSIRALDWSLVPATGFRGDAEGAIRLGTAALKKPDRKHKFKTWLASWLYDILAYDAGALYRMRNRRGDAIGLRPVDGTTLAPLIDYWGDSPDPPAEAYVQFANGVPWNWLTRDDLIYEPFRPRNNSPYGQAPLETILLNANTDLRFQAYFLQRFTEGNIPRAFATAPETWTPDQIEQFQLAWDAFMVGDQAMKHQIRWIPGGQGGIVWSSEKDFEDTFSLFLMRKTCLDEETEILTRRGWLQFPKLVDTDEVATRSSDGHFEWQKPTNYIAEPYAGDMVKFKSNSLDLLVTPDHRMLLTYFPTKKHPYPKEFIKTAAEIVGKGGYMIPMRSRWEAESPKEFVLPGVSYDVPNRGGKSSHTVTRPDVHIPMGTWMAFLGLWLAEGHVDGSKGGLRRQGTGRGLTYRVGISQSAESPYFGEIQALLDSLPFRWQRDRCGWVCQDMRLHTHLAPLGNSYSKYIPADVKNLGADMLEILWAWACKGDGHHYLGKSWHMVTASKSLADDWQEVLQKCGRDASISWRKPTDGGSIRGRRLTNCKGTWVVRERTSPLRTARGVRAPYEGMVYCVTVPNGVIYVRRNGRPAWVGNCAAFHVVPSDIGFTESVNRSSGETQADVQHRVGDLPLANFVQDTLTAFLQDDLHLPLEFSFDLGQEKEDRLTLAQAWKIYVETGAASSDEMREELVGLPADPHRPTPRYIMTNRLGPVPLLTLEGVAGKVDPETYGPAADQHVLVQPYVPPPGVIPEAGTTDAHASLDGENRYQTKVREALQGEQGGELGDNTSAALTTATTTVTKEGEAVGPAEGITSDAGLYGDPLLHDDDEESRADLVKAELAAFGRYRRNRRRTGKWQDFAFVAAGKTQARRLNQAGRGDVRKADGQPVAAGLCVLAEDTGRVLMLQRMLDTEDPAGGTWEFPGGCIEPGETELQAAWREFAEETGHTPPPGERKGGWSAGGGVYVGIVWQVPSETYVPIDGDRLVINPDDPDGDATEALAWWDPQHLADNPAVRPELLASLPGVLDALGYEVLAKASGDDGPKDGDHAWHGWAWDERVAAYYGRQIADVAGDVLTPDAAQQLVRDYQVEQPGLSETDRRIRVDAVRIWLASKLVDFANRLHSPLTGLVADAYLVGTVSAHAAVSGQRPDMDGWQPGSPDTHDRLDAIGVAAGAAIVAGAVADIAERIAGGHEAAAGRTLIDGTDASEAEDTIARSMRDAATDPGLAEGGALTEVTAASSLAAMDVYDEGGSTQVRWVVDPSSNVCAACQARADEGPVPFGRFVPPPLHPRCRCSILGA